MSLNIQSSNSDQHEYENEKNSELYDYQNDVYSSKQTLKRSQTISVSKYDTLTSRNSFKLNQLSSPTNYSFKENYNSLKRPVSRTGSFRCTNTNTNTNENLIKDLFRNQTNKPIPPNRTSSLQYKSQQTFQQKQALRNLKNSLKSNQSSVASDDRSSIYSSFSLRLSASNSSYLSSLNLENNLALNKQESEYMNCSFNLLSKMEISKIESFYKSIGSNIYASRSLAGLYTTNLQSLINLHDWKLDITGVPVWVFNTGLNPKRPKGLNLIIADKKTGFALWKSNPITFLNDFKWTRPGHVTFKIVKNKDSGININKKTKTSAKLNNDDEVGFLFAALKFDDEFECSKFYDFYRSLFVDSQNDDLFNPHFKPTNQDQKKNLIKVFYKRITKNSISGPVAFNHVNSLSIVFEEQNINHALNTTRDSSTSSASSTSSTSDTQSMLSEFTVTSHNNSSIITNNKRNKI